MPVPKEVFHNVSLSVTPNGQLALSAVVTDETYTFTPSSGPEINIYSGRLARYLNERHLQYVRTLQFPEQSLPEIVRLCGVDVKRVKALTEEQVKQPIIVGLCQNGEPMLIDGAHRRYYWAERGVHALSGWLLPYQLWSAYSFDPAQITGIVHDRV